MFVAAFLGLSFIHIQRIWCRFSLWTTTKTSFLFLAKAAWDTQTLRYHQYHLLFLSTIFLTSSGSIPTKVTFTSQNTPVDRYPHCGGCNGCIGPKSFGFFIDQLHFLLGVSIFGKNIAHWGCNFQNGIMRPFGSLKTYHLFPPHIGQLHRLTPVPVNDWYVETTMRSWYHIWHISNGA